MGFNSGFKGSNKACYNDVLIAQIFSLNSLNAELNPISHLLALLGAHHILHISRIRVNTPRGKNGFVLYFGLYFTVLSYLNVTEGDQKFSVHLTITLHHQVHRDFMITLYYIYIGCPRRNVPYFGRVFLMLKYTDITQNTYIQI